MCARTWPPTKPRIAMMCSPDGETWRGLVEAAEDRCSVYVRDDYGAAGAEEEIAKNWGGWWSPYDGTEFPNRESGREHIVAVAEAYDSGLCAAAAETRRRFGRDLDNLTLACAVERRCVPAGANPARQLSLQPEVVGAVQGGNELH